MLDAFAGSFARRFPDLLGKPVLVALSGGSDSVALLVLLAKAQPRLGCTPVAVHVHHHLRGADADADAEHCAVLCASLGIALTVAHLEPAPPRGISPEAWWRAERYRLLEAGRIQAGCAATATAHTMDDQAETVLLKLLRGSGPRGVAGVRPRRGAVIRPLLDVRREALREWLGSEGYGWREDASNLAGERPRSRLRRDIMPLLESVSPRAAEHLAALAAALADDEEILGAALAGSAWPELGRAVPLTPVAALPAALRRRWVLALAERLPLAEPPSRAQLAAVAALLDCGRPAAVDLGRRWVLRRRGERLHLVPPPLPRFAPVAATLGSCTALPLGLSARLGGPASGGATFTAVLSGRAAALPLAWRPAAAGERWPETGGRPLARALAAARVPAEWRRAWPLLEAGGTILWVPGVGVRPGWSGDEGSGIRVELEVPWRIHGR